MKLYLVSIFVCLSGLVSHADEGEIVEYFYGQAKIINLKATSSSDQLVPVLLKKTMLPDQNLMIEKATSYDEKGQVKDHIINMKVEGNSLLLSDDQETVSGTGKVHGSPWKWHFFEFFMTTKNGGIKIKDLNFRTKDRLIARKIIYLPNDIPLMLWEVEALEIQHQEYENLYLEMHSTKKP